MSDTTNYGLGLLPSGPVDWLAIFNANMNKIEVGRTLLLTAGETLTVRNCFYVKSDGKAWKATALTPCHGVWQSASTVADAQGYGQIDGTMTYASWTWTPGAALYSNASGALVATATPYQIGYAISATQIRIIPTNIILTLAAAATGFTIAGGTTSKQLTVSEDTTLNGGTHSGTNTGDETASRIATIITGAGAETTPLDADEFPFYKIVGTVLKKVTWANIKATLFTTPALGTPASGTLTNCTGLPLTGLVATAWTTPSFDAGNFTASGSMTWTVASGDVITYAYLIEGKKMTVAFDIQDSTIEGTPSNILKIAIPASKTATKSMLTLCRLYDNSASVVGFASVSASGTTINICRLDSANYTAGTNTNVVQGEIVFEIN